MVGTAAIGAQQVADYFLSDSNDKDDSDISNLKLQKLIYYVQAFHLAIYDVPFFDEDFEAWTHGPVCPEIYHKYKHHKSSPIPLTADFDPALFSADQLELLDEINAVFGQFSAWKLRNMTHDEPPWLSKESFAGVIDKASMQEFYKTQLK